MVVLGMVALGMVALGMVVLGLVVLGIVQVPSGTRMKKTNGFSVRYQTGIMNAGMPMPA
jgi:hypothetical protein